MYLEHYDQKMYIIFIVRLITFSTFTITPEVPILHNVSLSLIIPAPIAPQALSPPPANTFTGDVKPSSLAKGLESFQLRLWISQVMDKHLLYQMYLQLLLTNHAFLD